MRKGLLVCCLISSAALYFAGCKSAPVAEEKKIDYAAPLPDGEVALRKISPAQYPDFSAALAKENIDDLRRSIDNSLIWFARRGSQRAYPYLDISHDRACASLRAFRELIDHLPPLEQFNSTIASEFEVYQSIGAPSPDGSGYTGKVLFTGYFTPTYDASLTRGGAYQWPIYKRPADLVTDATGEREGRRATDGSFAPYYTRQQIESGALAGDELVWLKSRWEAYVVTVQGSGRLRLPDGRIYEVGYAGTNGYEYTSPAAQMIADGVITRDQLNFRTLKEYFQQHPEAMDKYLWMNQRTVFFAETPGGPFGAINVPVTPFASVATDKKVYPAGLLALAAIPVAPRPQDISADNSAPAAAPQTWLFNGFLLDQDRGGAIRSAGRADIYMGIGQTAEDMSGRQLSAGAFYYLALKPELVSRYLSPASPAQ